MQITILGELTDLNEYTRAQRGNRYKGATVKKRNTDHVQMFANQHDPLPRRTGGYIVSFRWFVPNKRKDLDNIAFAKKFVLDGLVEAGVLPGDGWRDVAGFGGETFHVDKDDPRVEVEIIPNE